MNFCSIFNPNPVFASVTVSNLTATRIPFADANKMLTDSANLTFASDVLTTTEINIGSVGSTGTKLAIGTASEIGYYAGLLEVASNAANPITTTSGICVNGFFSPTPTAILIISGAFFNRTTGLYAATGKTFTSLYGGSSTALEITDTTALRNLTVYGLQFTAGNAANLDKSSGAASAVTLGALDVSSYLLPATFTISGSKLTVVNFGGRCSGYVSGTFNSSIAGTNYGFISKTVNVSLAGTGTINSYCCYIDACASAALTGGGTLTSWGLYEVNGRNNALLGNLSIGKLTAPTVPLDVIGAILTTTTVEAGTNFRCGGTAAIADGTYTTGLKLTGGGVDGTITVKGGIVTALQPAT